MDAGTSAPTGTDAGLVGRGEESSRLTGLVTPPFAESQVLAILGDPGIGKTVLLASAVRKARAAGMRVLAAAGRESEQDLAFAGLHQLLRPVLDHVAYLPARQAGALTAITAAQFANLLRDQPDRRAWHLAAAALEPDERVASLLADTAVQAQRRGGAAAAARALERAAELSPSEHDQVRRLIAATALALAAGQGDWVQELAARVLSATAAGGTRPSPRPARPPTSPPRTR